MENTAPALVGTVEAATAIGVSYRTLQRYIADGQVQPTVKLPSGQYRWDVEDLRRQLRREQAEPNGDERGAA